MDKFSKEKRSSIMSAIKSKHTKPEMLLRKALWKSGYRYRLHYGKDRVDIAFVSKRTAVFVDGCFWHMCPLHGHKPKSNKKYWLPKLEKNVNRDRQHRKNLKNIGWKVIRVWEHELNDVPKAINKIAKNLVK